MRNDKLHPPTLNKLLLKSLVYIAITCLTMAIGAAILPCIAGDLVITGKATISSGTNGLCPGGYIGYVSYTKTTSQGWGWAPTNSLHTATDTNRTDTKVEFEGEFGDTGCNLTTVTLPDPPPSPKYRFTVYFTKNVPTNAYPLVLKGFSS